LNNGADKVSINSPALENPDFITELADAYGTQCVVVGVDSREEEGGYFVYQYTGDETKTIKSKFETVEWAKTAVEKGAGEIVLNCMNNDGMRQGYDLDQLAAVKEAVNVPVIASGGAGSMDDFVSLFTKTNIDGGLAASIFHKKDVLIPDLKMYLKENNIPVRI